jgi:hypothetical protein
MSQLTVEMVGAVVEGPLTQEDTERGGIKLVAFAGSTAAINEFQVHPSFVNLLPGQHVRFKHREVGYPEVSLEGEVDGTEHH